MKHSPLAREIHEELNLKAEVGAKVATTTCEYEFATIELTTFYCTIVELYSRQITTSPPWDSTTGDGITEEYQTQCKSPTPRDIFTQ